MRYLFCENIEKFRLQLRQNDAFIADFMKITVAEFTEIREGLAPLSKSLINAVAKRLGSSNKNICSKYFSVHQALQYFYNLEQTIPKRFKNDNKVPSVTIAKCVRRLKDAEIYNEFLLDNQLFDGFENQIGGFSLELLTELCNSLADIYPQSEFLQIGAENPYGRNDELPPVSDEQTFDRCMSFLNDTSFYWDYTVEKANKDSVLINCTASSSGAKIMKRADFGSLHLTRLNMGYVANIVSGGDSVLAELVKSVHWGDSICQYKIHFAAGVDKISAPNLFY